MTASSFAWLDYTEADRRRALDAIDLLHEPGTRDELGIGTVRDALAELLAPGLTTIQSRARYFLFVPWIYLNLERRKVPAAAIDMRARTDEVQLMRRLKESADAEGLVGAVAGARVKRLASSVYWGGLGRWRIRLFAGSQAQYHRSFDALRLRATLGSAEAGEQLVAKANWHTHIPEPPSNLGEQASFTLQREEAVYLQDRIRTTCQGSLLAWLIDREIDPGAAAFPWEIVHLGDTSPVLQQTIHDARLFSEAMHGAALLYNLMLALAARRESLAQEHRVGFLEWAETVGSRAAELDEARWPLHRFWGRVASMYLAPVPTRAFIEGWLGLLRQSRDWRQLADHPAAHQLIASRELRLKRARARLQNPRQLELWPGHSGLDRIDYRWRVMKTMVADILSGLRAET